MLGSDDGDEGRKLSLARGFLWDEEYSYQTTTTIRSGTSVTTSKEF